MLGRRGLRFVGHQHKEGRMRIRHSALILLGALLVSTLASAALASAPRMIMIEDFDATN